jgi:hypothetical protein
LEEIEEEIKKLVCSTETLTASLLAHGQDVSLILKTVKLFVAQYQAGATAQPQP